MATSIIQKANAKLKFLYRKRRFLNLTTRKLSVLILTQCHFDYANPGLSKVLKKNKLQITLNKIIPFVLDIDSKARIILTIFLRYFLLIPTYFLRVFSLSFHNW